MSTITVCRHGEAEWLCDHCLRDLLPSTLSPSQVRAALDELGPTARAVARSLRRRRIRGVPHSTESCPIGVYLRERFPEAEGMSAGYNDVEWRHGRVVTPSPVANFMCLFDSGRWRRLRWLR